MNIFYLDHDVRKCAEMHNDKHTVKMILEYAQLLSTAHRVLDGTVSTRLSKSGRKQQYYPLADERDNFLYSATHVNHPSAVWVRYSYENYEWLYKLFIALLDEYTHRYGRIHATARLIDALHTPPIHIPKGIRFTEPTPAMPNEVKVLREVATDRYEIDSIESYHKYYIHNKVHIAKWTKREIPLWYSEGIKSAYLQFSEQRNK